MRGVMPNYPSIDFWSVVERLESRPVVYERRLVFDDVFERHVYIPPDALRLVDRGFHAYAVFNPGGYLEGRRLHLYARIVVGYYWYVSIIARLEPLNVEELLGSRRLVWSEPLEARIIVYPSEWFESGRGAEDPRIYRRGDEVIMLYTGVAARHPDEQDRVSYQAIAFVRGDSIERKDVLSEVVDGERRPVPNVKNGAILRVDGNHALLLLRPLRGVRGSLYVARVTLTPFNVDVSSLRLVASPAEWEWRLGWSTNPVRLEKRLYLVGYHTVLRRDSSYHNGFMLLDDEGSIVGYTGYLLSPRTIHELTGERPMVVYGCTLVRYSERLVWVGGVADTKIGVFSVELDKVFEKVTWLKRW